MGRSPRGVQFIQVSYMNGTALSRRCTVGILLVFSLHHQQPAGEAVQSYCHNLEPAASDTDFTSITSFKSSIAVINIVMMDAG